ncbi:MAG: hypothetical protein M1823_005484 [Watsoniomyces obsoletus]|nr:MAG: hypothetical protein M1823_005484 [Watsoniomyces obsoletus]
MYFLREGSIVLAWCSTLSWAIPIAQSTPIDGGKYGSNTQDLLDREDPGARRVKSKPDGIGPKLGSAEGGVALVLTGLAGAGVSAAILNGRHKKEMNEYKLGEQKRTGEKLQTLNTDTRLSAFTYQQQMESEESRLGQPLSYEQKKGIWENCLKKYSIPPLSGLDFAGVQRALAEHDYRNYRGTVHANEGTIDNDVGSTEPTQFSVKGIEKAAQPYMAEMQQNFKGAGKRFKQNIPVMLSAAARRMASSPVKVMQ